MKFIIKGCNFVEAQNYLIILKMTKKAPEIFYSDEGKGNTIVFLHGFLESSEIWDEYSEKLSETYRVICVDLPGHGKSSCINQIHSMALMAEEVRNILEILGINKCLMVGHSMGGYVTMEFASKFSHYLKGIVLLNSHAGSDSENDKINRNRTIELIENDHTSFIISFYPTLFAPQNSGKFNKEIEWLRQIGLCMEKEGIIAALSGMRDRADHVQTLENINFPALVIAGDQDLRIPVEKIKQQLQHASKVKSVILEGVGHMGYIEAKDEVFKLIRNFAGEVFKKKQPL